MRELLFLAHRIPYPPNKGDKIRSWNILRRLLERYRVHLGCFVDDEHDWQHVDKLAGLCEETRFAGLRPAAAKLRSARGLLDGRPLTLHYYGDSGLAAWVDDLIARRRPERIFVFSSAMAQFVLKARNRARRVIDFVDVDSDKWGQYAARKSWPMSWVYGRESRTLLRFERQAAAEFDASLFVSAAEADLFRRLAPESADKVDYVDNGVDHDFFSPERDYEDPYGGDPNTLVFTGAMDYWANVDAVLWFAEDVLPALRQRLPQVRFCIVGANPAAEVSRLDERPGIRVTGRVPDVRPFLAHAAAVVAPLRVARGIQNKVLEAMAMAKPVIGTPEAVEGIAGGPGRELCEVVGSEPFAAAIAEVLRDGERVEMGRRARERVVADYGWDASFARLEALLEGDDPAAARA